jgi:hypothetical protein
VAKSVREPRGIVCRRKPAAVGRRSPASRYFGCRGTKPVTNHTKTARRSALLVTTFRQDADTGGATGLRHTEPMSQPDPWATMARATGAAGLVGMVLVFVPIVALASLGEPPFDATREEVVAFFRNTAESSWVDLAEAVFTPGSRGTDMVHSGLLPAAPPRGR